MERLTYRGNNGVFTGANIGEQIILKKLAAYEDTGLSPEEVTRAQQALSEIGTSIGGAVSELVAQIQKLKAERDKAVADFTEYAKDEAATICQYCEHEHVEHSYMDCKFKWSGLEG